MRVLATGGNDPLQSFPHVPKTGLSVLKCYRIQRAGRAADSHLQHMRIDHDRGYVRMPQLLLHRSDVGACLQQVGGG